MAVAAATNLSFLHFLERDYRSADRHATLALQEDRYNAKALVNKGNCLYVKKEYERARELFIEALNVEADCTEALYNLGLVNKQVGLRASACARNIASVTLFSLLCSREQLGLLDQALHAFEKLNAIVPNTAEVVYHIASIYEMQEYPQDAIEWYNTLLTITPHDPNILARLGQLYARLGEMSHAFNFFQQSYQYYPSNLDTLAWLGASCVENKVYDEAIKYFKRASLLQPQRGQWRLWMATCHRRMGNYQLALEIYLKIHEEFPDDVKCVGYLERIYKDMGMAKEAAHFGQLLQQMTRQSGRGHHNDTQDGDMVQRAIEEHRDMRVEEQYVPEEGYSALNNTAPDDSDHVPVVPEDRERREVREKQEDNAWAMGDDHLDELLPEG